MKKFLIVLLLLASPLAIASKITATSWLVADGNGKVLESLNPEEQRSIGSITKLMSAMVVLDAGQDLDQYIKPYTRKELIQLSIVHSDNKASEILCQHYPGGRDRCISAMNDKARALGMLDSKFIDPSGLGIMNISTAHDLIKLVRAATAYPEIVEASGMSEVKIKGKKRSQIFRQTNPLVAAGNFIISKTGYIRASGGCIVMMLDTQIGRRIVILLNSKNTRTRIPEAQYLSMNY